VQYTTENYRNIAGVEALTALRPFCQSDISLAILMFPNLETADPWGVAQSL